jgi:hypothetical protein
MQRLRFPPDTWNDSSCSIEMFVSGCLTTGGNSAQVTYTASSSHQRLVRLSCLNCKTVRRIPAPPLLQDDPGSPPDPESATQADGTRGEGRKRKRSKKKTVYKPPFFERPEHMLFRGNKMVVRTEDPPQGGMAAQVPIVEADVVSMTVG